MLQGKVAGHMGDLGKSSFTPQTLGSLLTSVMDDISKSYAGAENASLSSKTPTHSGNVFRPPTERERLRLELASRLLAASQQEFLCEAQWDGSDDVTLALASTLKVRGPRSDEWVDQHAIQPQVCIPSKFVHSPWVKYILLPLASQIDWQIFAAKCNVLDQPFAARPFKMGSRENCSTESLRYHNVFPILDQITKESLGDTSGRWMTSLSMIVACAELFPSGTCWTSDFLNGVEIFPPKDPMAEETLFCPSCTSDDLSSLVFLLAAFLDQQGGPSGGQKIQLQILAALRGLTEVTNLYYCYSLGKRNVSLGKLGWSWQLVWQTLFRPDLQYTDHTKDTSASSNGDFVLALIRRIIQYKCTDPALLNSKASYDNKSTFVYRNQDQIWSLPAFRSVANVASVEIFLLTSWLCHNFGLSDSIFDQIDPSTPRWSVDGKGRVQDFASPSWSRRRRLLSFSMAVIEACLTDCGEQVRRIIGAAMIAAATLMHGRMPFFPLQEIATSEFLLNDRNLDTFLVSLDNDCRFENLEWIDSSIVALWRNHSRTDTNLISVSRHRDPVSMMASRYRERVADDVTSKVTRSMDFVPKAEGEDLNGLALRWAKARFSLGSREHIDSDHASRTLWTGERVLGLKILFTFELGNAQASDSSFLGNICQFLVTGIVETAQSVDSGCRQDIFTDFLDVAETLLHALPVGRVDIGLSHSQLDIAADNCRKMLSDYTERLSEGTVAKSCGVDVSSGMQNDFYDSDDGLATSYTAVATPRQPQSSFAHGGIDQCSSDDDSSQRSRRKRKGSPPQATSKRQKAPESPCCPFTVQNYRCAETVGRLLLTVEPSVFNCAMVCRALLGGDCDLDPNDLKGDVDLRAAKASLHVLTSPNSLFHGLAKRRVGTSNAASDDSIVALFCKVLELVRVNLTPSTSSALFGYENAASILCIKAGTLRPDFRTEDLSLLVECLNYSHNTDTKPSFRAARLCAVTRSFVGIPDDFRRLWDKHFPSIVKSSMTDSDHDVRRLSRIGLSATLSLMNKKEELSTFNEQIPPISEALDKGERLKCFEGWCKESGCFQLVDDRWADTTYADLFEVMELESLLFKAAIASSVKDAQLFLDLIFELAMVPLTRPDLEIAALQALTKVAHAREYDSIEAMIETESPGLLFRWVKSQRTSLPLLVTAPAVLRRHVVAMGARGWNGHMVDMESLVHEALVLFLRQHIHFIVPFCVFECSSKVPPSMMEKEDSEVAISLLLDNKTLCCVASTLSGVDDSNAGEVGKVIEGMLRKSIADIRAFCYPMEQSSERRHCLTADRALALLASVLTVAQMKAQSMKKVHVISKRIIDLSSLSAILPALLPTHDLPFRDAVCAAIEDAVGSSNAHGDTLRKIGSNEIGSLVRSFARLDRSSTRLQQAANFKPIFLQAKLIAARTGNMVEKRASMAFCTHLLTEVVLKPELDSIRPQVLDLLKEQLDALVSDNDGENFRQEVGPLLERLVAATYHVHESCQMDILEHQRGINKVSSQALCRSYGLCLWGRGSTPHVTDIWGWESVLALSAIRGNVQRTLAGTFGILKWFLDHSDDVLSDSLAFVPVTLPFRISPEDLEKLRGINQSFAIQLVAAQHRSIHTHPKVSSLVEELSRRVSSRQAGMVVELEMEYHGPAQSSRKLNIDQKLILALLDELEYNLSHEENTLVVDYSTLIGSLSVVCGGPGPKELKVVASRCLAKMNARVIFDHFKANSSAPDSWSIRLPPGEGHSLFFHTGTLIALEGCLRSAESIVAQVAFETLEALLSTEQGCEALAKSTSPDLPRSQLRLISPLLKKKHGCVILSSTELNAVFRRAGMDEYSQKPTDWCWDKLLWLGFEGGRLTFEEWVCSLTTALIVSCTVTRRDGCVLQRDAHGEFFWLCQRMCSLDHSIASKTFPFLVLYLLDISDDVTNFDGFLSQSFSMVLKRCLVSPSLEDGSDSSRKAMLLILDTIDLLRRVSQSRFTSGEHNRNLLSIPEREPSKTKRRPSEYNNGLADPPHWEGIPYGVMMRLDGLILAEAYMHVRRHASALFYLELFMNARFGKVGELFDEFSCVSNGGAAMNGGTNEIGGSSQQIQTTLLPEMDDDCILRILNLASSSYKFMGEDDALEAVKIQSSAVEFHSFGWDTRQSSHGRRDPAGVLRSLNAESHLQTRRQMLLVADSMESLEFHSLLRSFIDGLLADSRTIHSMNRSEAEVLVAKWHESELRENLWDCLVSRNSSDIPSACLPEDDATHRVITSLQRNLGLPLGGFYGAISGALDFFRKDDFDSCRTYLTEGRLTAISEISRFGGLESSVAGMAGAVEKLRILELYEEVLVPDGNSSKGFSRSSLKNKSDRNLALTLQRLDDTPLHAESTGMDTALSFGWLKEACLSAAYLKKRRACAPGREDMLEALTSHIWISAVRARELGRPFVAAEAVQRLHGLFAQSVTLGEMKDSDSRSLLMLLRLEESKILESQGDFKGAIKKSQQIADQLLGVEVLGGTLDKELQHILTEAQLCCGTWLTKYKLRQASSVLEGFMQPAARRAQKLAEGSNNGDEDTARNEEKTCQANLAIGQIVSGLYEALVVRVRTNEWQTSSSTKHLKSELARCEPLLHEADAARKRTKKNSKQYDAVTKKWEDLFIFCEHLRKDLQRTEEERQSVIDSMHRYMRLAVESYAAALSLAGTGTKEDLSRPVTQLMSLWFENSRWVERNDEGLHLLMDRAFERIPTFRLVAFSNQLFSRIEKIEQSRSDTFQTVLQKLVCRMCSDHPYHCLLPLLALANGTKVGTGVCGRHAKDYLENVGNSKVDPANSIISRLKKEAAPYVIELLDGYFRLSDAYIDLAGADTSSFHKKFTKNISFATVTLRGSTPLDKCLGRLSTKKSFPPGIFTVPPRLQPTAQYHDSNGCLIGGESVAGFKSTFDITETGLHRPKIVVCYGSNGGEFRQLVKGEDEIRQDAIMSQVFKVVNSLMERRRPDADRKTGPRSLYHQLRMATYNVVPLSPASGVLEWVENTTAFGDIIVGKNSRSADVGLHARYYPKEWNYLLCRKHFSGAPDKLKRETFEVVCRHFSACFRFFFVEQFGHDMMKWHSARMRYTRSVAVSSMVGHILGIGDRHTSNILVHTQTGEIVQIDFGIVFEQGKVSFRTCQRILRIWSILLF